jgi:hypothetical protein
MHLANAAIAWWHLTAHWMLRAAAFIVEYFAATCIRFVAAWSRMTQPTV